MKKHLIGLIALIASIALNAQSDCTPDYNFGSAAFGVSHDQNNNEEFPNGVVGEEYLETLHILIPFDVSEIQIDGVVVPPGVALDSLNILSIAFAQNATIYSSEEMGLEVNCNNNNASSVNCSFWGGSQNCFTLSGIPGIQGLFEPTINMVAFITIFGNVTGIPVEYTLNSFEVSDCSQPGCTIPIACNYNPNATCSFDSSCTFPGCLDETACNYAPQAGCDDGSCIIPDGCTSPSACNYSSSAVCDDGSCTFPGCTNSGAVNYDPLAGCDDGSCIPTFGSFAFNAPDAMFYSDTLEVEVLVTGGQNIYALFATLQYNPSRFAFVGSTLGDYLGNEVLASPPIDTNGSIEFGASKLGQQPGSNGNGWFYTLRFVPISPNLVTPVAVDFSLIASDAFDAGGTGGQLFLPETHTVELIFEAEVWPGDLNHDGIVTVADILPIGYFYNIIGPPRPNASLVWESQNCPIWGTGAGFPGDGFYRVFADGNGDGVINLADQVAVGFNINQVVLLDGSSPNFEQHAIAQGSAMVVPISNDVSPALVSIPETETITIVFTATTTAANVESLFGFTMSIDLSPLGILASEAEVDFSVSEFGLLNQTMIAQVYGQASQLDMAITRTIPNSIVGDIVLFAITVPLTESLPADNYILPVTIGSANDPSGQTALLNAQNVEFSVNNPFGCTDNTACNYNPQATEDDGSCEYVELYQINGTVSPAAFSTVSYSYPSTSGSTYAWTVSNGVLSNGQGTSEVEVIWSSQGSGSVSVTETDDAACLGATVTLDVVVLPTNINELLAQNVSIYPNPALTWFTIELPENFVGGHVDVFSLTGKLVGSTSLITRSQRIDVSHLPSGMYVVHVYLPTGRSVQRLSVAR